jgi:hypothetical protein
MEISQRVGEQRRCSPSGGAALRPYIGTDNARSMIEPSVYRELGLSDEEYRRILELLGRELGR